MEHVDHVIHIMEVAGVMETTKDYQFQDSVLLLEYLQVLMVHHGFHQNITATQKACGGQFYSLFSLLGLLPFVVFYGDKDLQGLIMIQLIK